MTSSARLVLYTRPGCHLCEQAARMLAACAVAFEEVDVEESFALEQRYGIRIPVLARPGSGQELDFPFSEAAAKALAAQ